jgi:hypothetical protein
MLSLIFGLTIRHDLYFDGFCLALYPHVLSREYGIACNCRLLWERLGNIGEFSWEVYRRENGVRSTI